ncbi:MAG: glycosyltransferase, partial [Chthoniobacterales bacterium]
WELVQQSYNGVILSDFTPEAMAKALVDIYGTPGRLETMSRRCLEVTASSHTMEARWDDVRRFLRL